MKNEDNFWKYKDQYTPRLTAKLIYAFEQAFGYKLPQSYLELLQRANGGIPYMKSCKTDIPTSWSKNNIAIVDLVGISLNRKGEIDLSESKYWCHQILGYEHLSLLLICNCPSAGHDVVMLDYRACSLPSDEPSVVHMDDGYKEPRKIAENFNDFLDRLYLDPDDDE